MRAFSGAALIFTGIVLLATGWGAFAGILLVIAGLVLWGWGIVGSQQDESLDAGIIDPNVEREQQQEAQSSGLIDPNQPTNPEDR